jgi:hypothetical protein
VRSGDDAAERGLAVRCIGYFLSSSSARTDAVSSFQESTNF